jgi:HD-GYP domain-containing protein (c-di-GMP phosphodiesterase class II)
MRLTPESAASVRPDAHAFSDAGGDPYIRRTGRAFIVALHSALRAIRLYPPENEVVRKGLDEVASIAAAILEREGEIELRVTSEFIFINATRLRLDLDNYASFSQILMLCRGAGIGMIRFFVGPMTRDWLTFLTLLLSPGSGDPADRLVDIVDKLASVGVEVFELGPPTGVDDDLDERQKAKEAAKRTYTQSVAVAKDVINSVRVGRRIDIKRIKRVVQSIVDQILNEETSLLGLTTIRDYDEYTFTHSVNVCIFSVALGRRLGLTKRQLYELGLAALFHDVGKARVPINVIAKTQGLTEEEWRQVSAHPWLGVLALFQLRGQQDLPYRAMTVAFEHHMKCDLSGYPRTIRPRVQSIFSKIVAVADGFDAATSRRTYQSDPLSPAAVLAGMRDNPRRGMDPVVVKAFVNLLGLYPIGTLVVLDTHELAVVHASNPNPEAVSRPIVRVVFDARGNRLEPGELVDLTETDAAGPYRRTIIKTENPDRYGITVGDFFI